MSLQKKTNLEKMAAVNL